MKGPGVAALFGFAVVVTGLGAVPTPAGELAGVVLPDETTIDGRRLVLNGMGLREATIFKLDVYVAGLYLEARSTDAGAILGSPGAKRLVLRFVRAVGRGDLVKAWSEGFAKTAGGDAAGLRERIDSLNAWMGDVKVGDTLSFTEVPGTGIVVELDGTRKGTIAGRDFARALWGIWLGASPPNPELKSGLLGLGTQ